MKEEYYTSEKGIEHDLFEAGWKINNNSLQKEFVFKNFIEVIDFLNILWGFFEEAHHHPDFTVHFNRIVFSLTTHEKNQLTKKDFVVAQLIENVYLCLDGK